MSKIEIKNVYKIFGNNPEIVLPMVKEGASKEEVLDKTGHTVGLDNVSINIEEGETQLYILLNQLISKNVINIYKKEYDDDEDKKNNKELKQLNHLNCQIH